MHDKRLIIHQLAIRLRQGLYALVVLLVLCACSSEGEEETQRNDKGTDDSRIPIRITSLVGPTETRATGVDHMKTLDTYTVFTSGRFVDIFMTEAGNVENDPYSWRYDGTTPYYLKADGEGRFSWYSNAARTMATQKYWSTTGNSLIFYAWYPANVVRSLAETPSFTVSTDQGAPGGDADNDLMQGIPRAGNPIAPTEDEIPFVFNHRMAKIQVNLNNSGTSGIVTTKLNAAKVTLGPDIYLNCTLNPITAEITTNEAGAKDTVTLKDSGLEAVSTSDNSTVRPHYCVIPPQNLTGKKITIGEVDFTIPPKNGRDIIVAAGYEYIINLSVSVSMGIRLSTVDIAPWTEEKIEVDMTTN